MKLKMLSAAALCVVLAACGGGGDGGNDGSNPPADHGPKLEGFYEGTVTGGVATAFDFIALEDGTFYALAFDANGSIVSYEQGTGTSSDGHFSSSNARDFINAPTTNAAIAATFVAGTSFNGTLTGPDGTVTLAAAAVPASEFDYNKPAALADVAGNWTMALDDGEYASVTVSNVGAVSSISSGGCQATGTAKPRASGKNIFDVSMTSGGAPCAYPGQTTTGIALSGTSDDGTRGLIVMTVNSARTVGGLAVGVR